MEAKDSSLEIEIEPLSAAEQAVAAKLAAAKSKDLAETAKAKKPVKAATGSKQAKKTASKKSVKKVKKPELPPGRPRRWIVSMTDGSEREVIAENGMVAIRDASENPVAEGEKRRYVRAYAARLNEPHETVASWRAAQGKAPVEPTSEAAV